MLTDASALPAGACAGSSGWSVAAAAASQSTLTGVLAGFVFGGMVVVLSVRAARHGDEVASALKLQFAAFVGLTVAAFLLADEGGDQVCLRATSEKEFTDGLFTTFTIVAIVSLTWTIVAYERHTHGVLRLLRGVAYVATALVVLLKSTSSYSYLQVELPHGPPATVSVLIFLTGVLLYLAAMAARPRTDRSPAVTITRQAGPAGHGPPNAAGRARARQRTRVDRCAWLALGYLAVAAVGDAVVQSFSDTAWNRPDAPAAYTVAWASLLLPVGVLIAALGALAPEPAPVSGPGRGKETGPAADVPVQVPPRQAQRPETRQ